MESQEIRQLPDGRPVQEPSPELTGISLIALAVGLALIARAIDRLRRAPVVPTDPCPPHQWERTPEMPGANVVLKCKKCPMYAGGVDPWGRNSGN